VVSIPIKQRPVGYGGKSIPVVDLDTSIGSVTAAMVFPADSNTEQVFWRAKETQQKPVGTIRGIVNFNEIRWICPENIRIL